MSVKQSRKNVSVQDRSDDIGSRKHSDDDVVRCLQEDHPAVTEAEFRSGRNIDLYNVSIGRYVSYCRCHRIPLSINLIRHFIGGIVSPHQSNADCEIEAAPKEDKGAYVRLEKSAVIALGPNMPILILPSILSSRRVWDTIDGDSYKCSQFQVK